MKYYKHAEIEDDAFASGMVYLETDDGWPMRQIIVHDERYTASNIQYPDSWGFHLPDQQLELDDIDEFTPITRHEFEHVWQSHLEQHREHWEAAKRSYPIGTPVQGVLRVFYPQGVIIDLGNGILGLADHRACRASAQPAWMYPRHIVTAIVGGYDETMQWIILDEPRVHEEVIIP